MDIMLIIKVAGIGFLVGAINEVLKSSGKSDWTQFVSLIAIVVVMSIVFNELSNFITTIKTMFML